MYDSENQTPLMLAVSNGHKETVEVLLACDADLSIVDMYDKSVIYCAAEENSVDVLKVLLVFHLFQNAFSVFVNTCVYLTNKTGFG